MKFSIIIPAYNPDLNLLDCAIKSVFNAFIRDLSQYDFEIIIVDDGSRVNISLDKYSNIKNISLIRHTENRGLPAARNTGFINAKGLILGFLDADDEFHPDIDIENIQSILHLNSKAVVFSDIFVREESASNIVQHTIFLGDILPFRNTLAYSIFITRDLFEKYKYNVQMRDGYEDWELHLRLIHSGVLYFKSVRPWLVYRRSINGMLNAQSANRHFQIHQDMIRSVYGSLENLIFYENSMLNVGFYKKIMLYLIFKISYKFKFTSSIYRALKRFRF
jgi:glycosyltransferase involved in cell wall biosynthesis